MSRIDFGNMAPEPARPRKRGLRVVLGLTLAPTLFCVVFSLLPSLTGLESVTLSQLQACPAVVSALGQPMARSWLGLSYGSVSSRSGRGSANWVFPVRGSRGRGRVELYARKQDGQWRLSSAMVTTGGTTIDAIRCAPAVTAASIRPAHADAFVASVAGTPGVAVGDACTIDLRRGDASYACRVQVRCGAIDVYGSGTTGWIRPCGPDATGALEARDTLASPADRDPTLELHFGTGQAVITDQTSRGTWALTLTFPPQH
jgi:hypothetical protein